MKASSEFDVEWYLARYPDVALTGIDPARHYLLVGSRLGRNPSPAFDTGFYLSEYPDVHAAKVNPLLHYLLAGRHEGRHPMPIGRISQTVSENKIIARLARYRIDRNAPIEKGDDWLVFVAYTADGLLSDCQRFQIEAFTQAGYSVALVVNTDSFADMVEPVTDAARIIIVRENLGYDFGAWRHAIELLGGLTRAASATFSNDSVMPARDSVSALARIRQRIAKVSGDALFLTSNHEIRPHLQSYFFAFTHQALSNGVLDVLATIPFYRDKDSLIQAIELYFADRLREAGFLVDSLFDLSVEENPTIHHWERLLDDGFPFVKIQLVTASILSIDDERLSERLGKAAHNLLKDHCHGRGAGPQHVTMNVPGAPMPAMPITCTFNEYGAQQATNPSAALMPTIRVPLAGEIVLVGRMPRILAMIHGFYLDILSEILDEIAALGIEMRILVTTDAASKVEQADTMIRERYLRGQAVLCKNRGRDVAPFLVEGGKHLGDAEVILHLHTKKSPHDSVYAGWGQFLRDNLIGSRDIVLSILKMLSETQVGIVFSDHFPAVIGLRNWGFDFDHARELLSRIGCTIDGSTPLEFPTSTMFWVRRDALEPLFALGLDYTDFEDEAGQIDGTLAHAIERSLLYIVEHAGYGHAKVTVQPAPTDPASQLLHLQAQSVTYALDRPMPQLNGGVILRSDFYNTVPEIYPVGVARSRSPRLRLNAILPTMKPEKIYGGITTALLVIRRIVNEMEGEVDVRVLITSDSVDRPSVDALSARLDRAFIQTGPSEDVSGNVIVGVAHAQHEPISVRAGDMYVGTAWWTADLGFRLIDQQRAIFGANPQMAYIIQDYEPGFYNWSNHYALAEATYHRPNDTIAIINSEELAGFLQSRCHFREQQFVPYELHPRLAELIEPTRPEKLILAYGRPTVDRNCFELLCEGFRVWQARNPRVNCSYEIVFAGEEFDQARLKGLENARNVGKMSIEDYAGMLNRACAGVSLMISPHPSYPPLEMASAGCMTVTNTYDGKDLRLRSDRFVSVEGLTPTGLADAIDVAITRVDFGSAKPIRNVGNLAVDLPKVDYARIASMMLARARS